LTREEVEAVGYRYGDLETMRRKYLSEPRRTGWHTLPDGERFFFVSNPALGLWAERKRFERQV
jgi:hypothetical protein